MLFISSILILFSQNNNDLKRNTIFNYSIPQKDVLYYSYKIEPTVNSKKFNVNFYFQILNNSLVFNKTGNSFQSIFEIKLFINKNNEMVGRKIWVDTITVNEFVKTNLNDYYYESHRTFELDLEDYVIDVQFFDVNAKKINESKTDIFIKSFVKDHNIIGFSNFIIDNQYAVNQWVLPYNKRYVLETVKLDHSLSTIYLDVLNKSKITLFRKKTLIGHVKRFEKISIPISYDFKEGDYKVILYHLAGDTKVILDEKSFTVRWWEKPELLFEPALALRPFKIILNEKELMEFESKNVKEQIDFYIQFWEKNNKTKKSNNFNELQYEFYKRVDYVVKKYTDDSVIGWQTDIGKSHLLYGFPVEVNQFYKDNNKFLLWKYSEFEILFVFNILSKQYITYSFKKGH